MEDVYYNPSDPGSFGGIKRLEGRCKKKRKDVRKWLTFQDTYIGRCNSIHIQRECQMKYRGIKANNSLIKSSNHFFSTENDDINASVMERFNRTLKSKMWRYFTYTRKKRYVDTLEDLILSYNNSNHRTIRMSPSDVTSDDELNLLRDMYNIPVPREPKQSFRVGDSVNIAMSSATRTT